MGFVRSTFIVLSCLVASCSKQRSGSATNDPLAQKVWQTMLAAESQSQYSVKLTGDVARKHALTVAFLRDKIPLGYPEPYLPYGLLPDTFIDFPLARSPVLNASSVSLGKKLFSDPHLSFSSLHGLPGGTSCASCHLETKSFADGLPLSKGVDGDSTRRNTPTLLNAAYASTLTWANPVFPALEMQARIPLFGDDPIEMGLKGKEREVLAKLLASDMEYGRLIKDSFGLDYEVDDDLALIDYTILTTALASYERTLIDFNTKFDRFLQGRLRKGEEYTAMERDGLELFYGFRTLKSGTALPCAQCHAGPLLTDSFQYVRDGVYFNRKSFRNTGLYNEDGNGAYPKGNTGFATALQLESDPALMGQFRVPSLRFVALTAPYSHDGGQASLEAVVADYAAGGRAARSAQGQNPFVDPLLRNGFVIDTEETHALVEFLKTLH